MKFQRHNRIVEIISEYNIETQEELIEKLRESGMPVTQATVSRDIKEMGLVKVATRDSQYKYSLPQGNSGDNVRISAKYRNIIRETIIKADYAGNIVVLRTFAGMANAAAAAVDGMGFTDIVGSIAGDDTIFFVMRSNDKARDFTMQFRETLSIG